MPRPPATSSTVAAMRGGVFSNLAHRIAALQGEIYPFHVGDTWLEPMVGARMQDLRVEDHPGMHRYAQPHGHGGLLGHLAERYGVPTPRILVGAGATGALGAVAGAVLDPGDEVLILAPYWPLIRGIVQSARGVAVDVPFYDRPGTVAERLSPHLTPRTVALYLNTPNNPTGAVLSPRILAEIAAFAREHSLWIWSDEVYERITFEGEHAPMAPFAPDRTFTVSSASKSYGMAGNRVGWVVGPDDPVMVELRKISTHTFYAAPTSAQIGALAALRGGEDWIAQAREGYARAAAHAADTLGLPRPQGGTFLFVDVAAHLDARGLQGFLEDLLDDNLILAPGPSFGEAYGTWARLCFTAAPPDVTARGVEKLARRLGR